MTLRLLLGALIVGALLIPTSSVAQLAAPGDAGIAMGHIHLLVRDVEAHRHFWAALGGTPVQNGPLQLIQLPGVFMLLRQGEPTGGTVGSVINHFGFNVKNMQESQARWKAAGIKIEPGTRPGQAWLTAPDEVRIEIFEETTIAEPIRMHHIHWNIKSAPEIQSWYAKHFGALPGKRGQFDAGDLPGVNLTFGVVETAQAPIKGRALDHIGFEVRNLQQFIAKLEASGVKLDQPFRHVPNTTVGIAFLTDPWGTYIELTENLAPKQ